MFDAVCWDRLPVHDYTHGWAVIRHPLVTASATWVPLHARALMGCRGVVASLSLAQISDRDRNHRPPQCSRFTPVSSRWARGRGQLSIALSPLVPLQRSPLRTLFLGNTSLLPPPCSRRLLRQCLQPGPPRPRYPSLLFRPPPLRRDENPRCPRSTSRPWARAASIR